MKEKEKEKGTLDLTAPLSKDRKPITRKYATIYADGMTNRPDLNEKILEMRKKKEEEKEREN